jgi:hypothetical protein
LSVGSARVSSSCCTRASSDIAGVGAGAGTGPGARGVVLPGTVGFGAGALPDGWLWPGVPGAGVAGPGGVFAG